MALAISNIPFLSGDAAIRFVRTAEKNARNRGSVDFSSKREYRSIPGDGPLHTRLMFFDLMQIVHS